MANEGWRHRLGACASSSVGTLYPRKGRGLSFNRIWSERALEAGNRGYVLKVDGSEDLMPASYTGLGGGTVFGAESRRESKIQMNSSD